MRDNAANADVILPLLPGSSRRIKLDALVSHAREFASLFADFMGRVLRGEASGDILGDEDATGVHRRAGVDVTQDVIRSLELLRDGR